MFQMCKACGVFKDMDRLEVYPHEDDGLDTEEPIPPMLTIHVAPEERANPVWKKSLVCHTCFHRLQPDMWIDQRMWEGLNPVVTFDDLPVLEQRGG